MFLSKGSILTSEIFTPGRIAVMLGQFEPLENAPPINMLDWALICLEYTVSAKGNT